MPRVAPVLLSALALFAGLLSPAASHAAAGDLDPSFSGDGRVAVPAAGAFVARAVALQADGRILVAGYSCAADPASRDGTCLQDGDASFRLARLTPDGGLDPEFGDNGLVTTAIGTGRSQAFDMLLLGDGRIVLGGVARDRSGRDDFALAVYDSRGALDPGFGTKGVVVQPIGTGFAAIGDLTPGPGGTIVATGQAQDAAASMRMAIARFTAAGALDGSFGDGGVRLIGPAYGFGLDLAATPDGGVVAAGVAGGSADPDGFRFGLARLGADGAPAGGFGSNGWVQQSLGSAGSFANALLAVAGNRWLAAGAATEPDGLQVMALLQLNGDGTPDTGFDGDGYAVVRAGDGAVANDLLAGPGGAAVLVGQAAVPGGLAFAQARVTAAGAPDPSFGNGGLALTRWDSYPSARATAGALDGAGRLIAVGLGCSGGSGVKCTGGNAVLLLARYHADPPPPPAPPQAPPAATDTRAPAAKLLHMPRRLRRSSLARTGLRIHLQCDEDCSVDAVLSAGKRRLAHSAVPLGAGPYVLRLRPSRATVRRLHPRKVALRLSLRDAAGNARTLRRTIRMR